MLRDLFSLFPAYAGVIPIQQLAGRPQETFPRIRGGDPEGSDTQQNNHRLFPAYAGVIPLPADLPEEDLTFPRIRGGDPSTHDYRTRETHFSPHTRG